MLKFHNIYPGRSESTKQFEPARIMISSTDSVTSADRSRTDSIVDRFHHADVYSEEEDSVAHDAESIKSDKGDSNEDHYNDNDDDEDDDDEEGVVKISRSPGVTSDVAVVKWTYNMVRDSSRAHSNIISWNTRGDAFKITDVEALETSILGKYFITTKYQSFQRQMRNYGFVRWSGLPVRNNESTTNRKSTPIFFKHEFFKRGRPDLLQNIKRRPKSNKKRASNADEALTLKARIVSMEESQSEMRKTVQTLTETSAMHRAQISRLQQFDAVKDDTLKAMNYRIRSLESSLFAMQVPPQPQSTHQIPQTSFLLNPPAQYHVMEGAAFEALPFLSTVQEQPSLVAAERQYATSGLSTVTDHTIPDLKRDWKMKGTNQLFHSAVQEQPSQVATERQYSLSGPSAVVDHAIPDLSQPIGGGSEQSHQGQPKSSLSRQSTEFSCQSLGDIRFAENNEFS